MSDRDHETLLCKAVESEAMVMISGYRCNMYESFLFDWVRIDYQTQTRGGMKDESLWMNFPEPTALHDYSFLGENFRDRERIKRKAARFKQKFDNMPRLEKLAIMEVVSDQGGVLR